MFLFRDLIKIHRLLMCNVHSNHNKTDLCSGRHDFLSLDTLPLHGQTGQKRQAADGDGQDKSGRDGFIVGL